MSNFLHYLPLLHWWQIYEKTSKQIVVTYLFMSMKIDHLFHLRPHVAFLEASYDDGDFLSGTSVYEIERISRNINLQAEYLQQKHGKNFAVPFLRSRAFFVCVWNLLACCISDLSINNFYEYASIKKSTPKFLQRYQIFLWWFSSTKNKQGSGFVDLSLYIISDIHHHRVIICWTFMFF